MLLFKEVFSIKACLDGLRKCYTFCGVRFKLKNSELMLRYYNEIVIHTALLHQKSFGDLKYINSGKNVVICATGPTLDYYKPIEGAVHIGLKEAFRIEKIRFDYLFHHDVSAYEKQIVPREFTGYRGKDCIKFIGNSIPFLSDKGLKDNGIRFFNSANEIRYQIDYFPLPDYHSIVFPAFAFALWTKPEKIYLVGADCSKGYSKKAQISRISDSTSLINSWKLMKEFAEKFYPDVEIISVNPVGLKGLFKDIYTEEYLRKGI